jgi:hypothetical protein
MDAHTRGQHHAPVRVLTHIKKLDDCFGRFLVAREPRLRRAP